jgi:hypothetical protein
VPKTESVWVSLFLFLLNLAQHLAVCASSICLTFINSCVMWHRRLHALYYYYTSNVSQVTSTGSLFLRCSISSHSESRNSFRIIYTYKIKAVWKVRGLTLLLRVGTLWRCGDCLFVEVLPLASDALLTTLHPFLEVLLQTVCRKLQEDSGTGAVLGLLLRSSSFAFVFPSLKRFHHVKTAARLRRLDGWDVGFLIHFFQAEHRI